MRVKYLVAGLVSLGLMAEGAAPALAGGSDVVGGIIGGIIGGAIVNEANRSHRTTTVRRTAPKAPAVSSYQREQNREVQTSLNYFGYPVGSPDGVLGAKSRAAIGQYQALLGYPATGQLTEMERQILVTAYNRAMIGGPQVQQAAAGPQGIRGMLLKQRDEMMGGGAMGGGTYASNSYGGLPPEVASAVDEISRNSGVEGMQLIQRAGFIQLADMNNDGRTDYLIDTAKTGSGFWCNGSACTVEVFASTPSGYQRNDFQLAGATPASFSCLQGACSIVSGGAPTAVAAQPAMPAPTPALPGATMVGSPAPAMPSFTTPVAQQPAAPAPAMPSFGSAMAAPKVTLVSYCSGVKAKAGANGMPQTVAMMNDPAQALGEQFCQVSAAAKEEGETLAKGIQGFTPPQIADQCRGFGAALKDQVALIGTTPRDDMIASIQGWIAQSGMPEDQLVGTAKVCLGMGYGTDEPEVALASALVLSGTGNMVYAELIGHHLVSGVGIDKHADLALDWYDLAGNALSIGQTPVFLPDQPDRAALIHKAAMALNGRAEATPMLPVPVAAAPSTSAGAAPGGLVGFAGAAANLIATGAAKIPTPVATSAP
ncbi:MAG: peptidoglycan-binding domain-containing protein [Paenirhodobacter sp.]|uniref:peptidoglycan-binding domain-containing protein n=1 Tax=Paenirhodobacter sp. TaxID=1965326 RepID=UPI003D0A502D